MENIFLSFPFLLGSINFTSTFGDNSNSNISSGILNSDLQGSQIFDIDFNIYTRENPIVPHYKYEDIDVNKPLKIFMHGFLQDAQAEEYIMQKNIYLELQDCTVIILDWSRYNREYLTAVVSTKPIGELVGRVLYKVFSRQQGSFNKTHILGHSLGAHMAGFSGKVISLLSNNTLKIARITGWDPALPLINVYNPKERLSTDDATLVDVIHTDINRAGLADAIGHVDFYPNGGGIQPGCWNIFNNILNILQGKLIGLFCSHSKCREYYRRTLTGDIIYATKCSSWYAYTAGQCDNNEKIVFGEYMPWNARGSFYFHIE